MDPPPRWPYREPTLRAPAAEPRRLPPGALMTAAVVALSSCCGGPYLAWIILFGVAVAVPFALIMRLIGRRERARRIAVGSTLLGATSLLVLLLDSRHGAEVVRRNERLIVPAIDRFRAEHGRYPERLQELVPRYLPSTRPAGWSLPGYRINYWRHGDTASLVVTVVPPYGRCSWDFERHQRFCFD